jgi:hypothetical protein
MRLTVVVLAGLVAALACAATAANAQSLKGMTDAKPTIGSDLGAKHDWSTWQAPDSTRFSNHLSPMQAPGDSRAKVCRIGVGDSCAKGSGAHIGAVCGCPVGQRMVRGSVSLR